MTRTLLAVCALTLVVPAAATAQNNSRNFQFRMEAEGMPPILFTMCSGIGSVSEVIEVRDGNSGAILKTPGRTNYTNVVCNRPVSLDNTLFDWRKEVENGQPSLRKAFTLTLLDRNLNAVKAWKFTRGWPVKWELPEFDASKNEVAIETLEIAHEGWTMSK